MFVYMPQQQTAIHVNYAMVKGSDLVVSNGFVNLTEHFDDHAQAVHWLQKITVAINTDQKMFYVRGIQPWDKFDNGGVGR